MAIQVADNFSYKGGKPLDARSKYATLAAMKAAAEADLYDGCMAYVDAEDKYYTFNSSNTVDATTGKWRIFESGGGASDLADLGDVNLTSPTNGQVLKYDAVNEKWVNGDESGGGGGHEILDNGTAMTARAGLNFVDFDISDDSTDDETEVSAHRLTSAEMDEIMGTLPGTPTELPVLFDERGTEYQVGWYVLSDGTKKPIYRKDYKGTKDSSGHAVVFPNVKSSNNIDKVVDFKYVVSDTQGRTVKNYYINNTDLMRVYFDTDGGIYAQFGTSYPVTPGAVITVSVYFTKTTDTPS